MPPCFCFCSKIPFTFFTVKYATPLKNFDQLCHCRAKLPVILRGIIITTFLRICFLSLIVLNQNQISTYEFSCAFFLFILLLRASITTKLLLSLHTNVRCHNPFVSLLLLSPLNYEPILISSPSESNLLQWVDSDRIPNFNDAQKGQMI